MNAVTRRGVAALLAASALSAGSSQAQIRLPQQSDDSAEGRARKARSERRLRAESVPVLVSLPVLDPLALTKFRTTEETVDRALCLAYVAALAETGDRNLIRQFFRGWDAEPHLSPQERAFVLAPMHSSQDQAKFSWRYESLGVLAWALGQLEDLGRPDHQIDVAALMGHIRDIGVQGFRSRAAMRSGAEILDLLDLTYRYDWAAVDARIHGRPAPAGLSEDVIVEWHQALNWLTCYEDQDWDDVSTDT